MKILIVNLMQIGDLVLTTPVFEALRKSYPNAFIAAAVNNQFACLVEHNPYLNLVFKVDKLSFQSFLLTLNQIRTIHFDFAINLNSSERASALTAFSGANIIAGYSNSFFKPLFHIPCTNFKRLMHQVNSHFLVLRRAGLNVSICKTSIFIPNDVHDRINLFCNNLPHNNLIAFNVGASWSSKRWLPSLFATLANSLIKRGFHLAFLGSNLDFPIVEQCLAAIPLMRNVYILTGKLNLLELAAFFDHCALLVTNDSGPMHIAVARNIPTVSIFGASPIIGFEPFDYFHIALRPFISCHPCFKHSCPKFSLECMKSISPQRVFAAVLKLFHSNYSTNNVR